MVDEANSNEGADPSGDIKKQNPGQTTSGDIWQGGKQDATKIQDLAKAGRPDFDVNAGQE